MRLLVGEFLTEGTFMGVEHEVVVRAFLAEFETDQSDSALSVDRLLSHMASDSRYQVIAWEDPYVGADAIRAELLRQASVYRDFRCEILAIASADQTVFTERTDSMILRGKPVTVHIAGVFEVDAEGKIAAWRAYLDSREVSVLLGADESSAGPRG
jgi:limonene-1,2-epoxide hydrolase